jgi:hypothetical protein
VDVGENRLLGFNVLDQNEWLCMLKNVSCWIVVKKDLSKVVGNMIFHIRVNLCRCQGFKDIHEALG